MNLARAGTVFAFAPLVACAMPTASQSDASSQGPGGDWSCAAAAAAAESPRPASTPLTVRIREAYSGVPVVDADVVVCDGADQDCTAPVAHARADLEGVAQLGDGGIAPLVGVVLRITAPEIATHYVFLTNRAPPAGSTSIDVDVYIPAALQAMARLAGVPWDPQGPVVRVDAQDCAGAAASGVTVSIGGSGATHPVVAYLDGGGRPTRRAGVTDATGIALGFGASPGAIGVADLLDGRPVGGALGFARPGTVSMLVVRP